MKTIKQILGYLKDLFLTFDSLSSYIGSTLSLSIPLFAYLGYKFEFEYTFIAIVIFLISNFILYTRYHSIESLVIDKVNVKLSTRMITGSYVNEFGGSIDLYLTNNTKKDEFLNEMDVKVNDFDWYGNLTFKRFNKDLPLRVSANSSEHIQCTFRIKTKLNLRSNNTDNDKAKYKDLLTEAIVPSLAIEYDLSSVDEIITDHCMPEIIKQMKELV